jgi:hypothetical protein
MPRWYGGGGSNEDPEPRVRVERDEEPTDEDLMAAKARRIARVLAQTCPPCVARAEVRP